MEKAQNLNVNEQVMLLVNKAAEAKTSDVALKFSKAARNVANACCAANTANAMGLAYQQGSQKLPHIAPANEHG